MVRTKIKCPLCSKEISKSNYSKHQRSHEAHPEIFCKQVRTTPHEGLECQFCRKICKNSNSLVQHEIRCNKNPNRLGIPENFIATGHTAWNKGLTKETDERLSTASEHLSEYYKTHDAPWKNKHHSEETKKKIGLGVKKFLQENPEMIPYKRNHSSKTSYPEKYFKELFSNEGIDLMYHYPVGSYELDFCNPSIKLDIEIDGEQHYLDKKIVEHDKVRNDYLTALGWTIVRIRWSTYKKLSGESKYDFISYIKTLIG